jgi:hypothetical protein
MPGLASIWKCYVVEPELLGGAKIVDIFVRYLTLFFLVIIFVDLIL